MSKSGVLLVNLGTPSAPTLRAVHKYLTEFLTDPRVIDLPWLKRQLLVRGVIIPLRLRNTTRSYQTIWRQQGSPLSHYSRESRKKLQEELGDSTLVEMAMRYPSSSCNNAIARLMRAGIEKMTVIPLFPQYASATTGSVIEHVMNCLKSYNQIPEIKILPAFFNHAGFIRSFAEQGKALLSAPCDKVLFSFHGLPMRQLHKADRISRCGQSECCTKFAPENLNCYGAQCYATAAAIASSLSLKNYEVCFQSRLGKEPWMTPFTQDRIIQLAQEGAKRLVIFCPSFVTDCLETLYEIAIEYQELFRHAGGEKLELVPSLNDSPLWIKTLAELSQS